MSLLTSARSRLRRSVYGLVPSGARSTDNTADHSERGDVPGWVLVTLMTAGLVTLLWQTAGPLLKSMFTNAMQQVSG